MEENVDYIPLLMREGDKKENILHIPLSKPHGNILYADLKELDKSIVGIAYKTDSEKRVKVGFFDKSMDQLRYITPCSLSKNLVLPTSFVYKTHKC